MSPLFSYRAFGLNISSELALSELPEATNLPAAGDLRIEVVDSVLDQMPPEAQGAFLHESGGAYVLRVPDTADFLVDSGKLIRMSMSRQGDPGMAKLYLLGSALGLALHQRGCLVLHASAVLHSGNVTMFVGDSGAGKSTLAAGLAKAGHGVLADDLLVVDMARSGQPEVWPGARSFKLWADTLDALGLERGELSQVSNRLDKYFLFNPRTLEDAAYPLAEIIVLDTCEDQAEPSVKALSPLEAVRAISNFTYRPEYVDLLGRRADHFQQCVALASMVSVRRFRRFWDPTRIQSGVDLIEQLSW